MVTEIPDWAPVVMLTFAPTALAGCMAAINDEGSLAVCVQDQVADAYASVLVTFEIIDVRRAGGANATEATQAAERQPAYPSPGSPTSSPATSPPSATSPPTAATGDNATGPANATGASPTRNETSPPTQAIRCLHVAREGQAFATGVGTNATPAFGTCPAATGPTTNTTATPTPANCPTESGTSPPGTVTATIGTAAGREPVATPQGGEGCTDPDRVPTRGPWIGVASRPTTIDLLAFRGDVAALVGCAFLPAGEYSGLRVRIADAWGIRKDGTQVNFTIPPHESLFNERFAVNESGATTLVLDFDLDRSLVGEDAGAVRFQPVAELEVVGGGAGR